MQFPTLVCQRLAGKVFLPASGWFVCQRDAADLSGKTPEFRVLEIYCIIWVYWMNKGRV